MKLTIEHLTPYLPYGLNYKDKNNETVKMNAIDIEINYINFGWGDALEPIDIKPILRPLSDLTKEIEHNGEKFVPIEHMFGTAKDDRNIQAIDHLHKFKDGLVHRQHLQYWIIELLFEYHFDVFELIPNNLAIDINTL